jgi:hypothetical protein
MNIEYCLVDILFDCRFNTNTIWSLEDSNIGKRNWGKLAKTTVGRTTMLDTTCVMTLFYRSPLAHAILVSCVLQHDISTIESTTSGRIMDELRASQTLHSRRCNMNSCPQKGVIVSASDVIMIASLWLNQEPTIHVRNSLHVFWNTDNKPTNILQKHKFLIYISPIFITWFPVYKTIVDWNPKKQNFKYWSTRFRCPSEIALIPLTTNKNKFKHKYEIVRSYLRHKLMHVVNIISQLWRNKEIYTFGV